ncbi:MAG: hypothetical protein ACI4JJ_08080 [Huintestinicola sp.]
MTKLAELITKLFRRHHVENIMAYITATMAIIWAGDFLLGDNSLSAFLSFDRSLILQGQVWRAVTFLFIPPKASLIWIIFSLYIYYAIGSAVEKTWGSRDFNAYFFTGALLTIAAGFITGYAVNDFLYYSFFFAFAAIYGEAQFLLFFLIPVKAKWLAAFDAVYMLFILLTAHVSYKASVLAALLTFGLFFGGSFFRRIKNKWTHRDFYREMKNNRR